MKADFRNKIKNNKIIIGLKSIIYFFFKPVIKRIGRMKANKCILKVINNKSENPTVKVGFLVQMVTVWDKQEEIYSEILRRDGMEAFLFVVPEDDWSNQKIENSYDNNYFLNRYSESIKIYNSNGSVIDLTSYNLDYLFYPRPYDAHLPKELRSNVMRNYTKCCYIPYGFTGADVFNEGNVYNSFFDNIYFCFMDSEYMRKLLENQYQNEIKRGLKKIEYLGYPALEKYLDMPERDIISTMTWTPRWSYDKKLGGSNFLEYKDDFVELINRHKGEVIFRPHPLMFDELVNRGLMSEENRDEYITKLKQKNTSIDMFHPIDEVLEKTDLLISDFSTIVGTFFLTGKPIIYCDKGIVLNEVYAEMAEYMYIAYNWNDVEKYYTEIVLKNNDYKKSERQRFIKRKYCDVKDSAKKIVDAIITDKKE